MDPRLAPFHTAYDRESATTLKVLRAYPADQGALKPHERSSSAHTIGATFVVEQRMILATLRDGNVLGSGVGTGLPETFDDVVATFERDRAAVLDAVRAAGPAQIDRTVQFFTGPKQLGDYAVTDFLWFLLHDQIHHRGQLSVYLRMAGGKVPSIYGPTADEPWN